MTPITDTARNRPVSDGNRPRASWSTGGPANVGVPLQEIRQRLHARRLDLFEQMTRIERAMDSFAEHVAPEAQEAAQEESMSSVLLGLGDHDQAEIAAIDAALQRIATNRYGICACCGEPIATERLRAMPAALTCLPCAATAAPSRQR